MAAAPVLPASPVPMPEPTPLSQGARIVNTFIAPSKTFTDLRRNASWWAPWLLIAVCAALFAYAMGKQVGFEQISKSQVEHSKRADQFDKLPADQQAAQLRVTGKVVAFFSYFSPFLLLLYCLIGTLVLWLTFKLVLGGETTFGQAYAITMHAWLPGMIFVRAMASSLDFLSIWTIILIGIGYACTSKVKRSTAITIVAVWYLVFKLVTSGLGAM